jgi:tRNA(Ile)-lysidine synthase
VKRQVAVATSGGRDSTALLHATARQAHALGVNVHALHVHHGLQPAADAWVEQLQRQVGRWARAGWPVQLHVSRLHGQPARGESVEAWARRERYQALGDLARACGCELVLLAHHRRDQAETVLMHLLRGAQPLALAAMVPLVQRDGLCWARPWLAQPTDVVQAYVRRHRLSYVDDPSNASPAVARGRMRQQLWPVLEAAFPHAEAALVGLAERTVPWRDAAAQWLAADLARLRPATGGAALRIGAWRDLPAARRLLVLQAWLTEQGVGDGREALLKRLAADLMRVPLAGPRRWPVAGRAQMVMLRHGELSAPLGRPRAS